MLWSCVCLACAVIDTQTSCMQTRFLPLSLTPAPAWLLTQLIKHNNHGSLQSLLSLSFPRAKSPSQLGSGSRQQVSAGSRYQQAAGISRQQQAAGISRQQVSAGSRHRSWSPMLRALILNHKLKAENELEMVQSLKLLPKACAQGHRSLTQHPHTQLHQQGPRVQMPETVGTLSFQALQERTGRCRAVRWW